MYLPRGDVVCQIVSRVQDSSKSKVAQLNLALLGNQDVFWLHVSMDALEKKLLQDQFSFTVITF